MGARGGRERQTDDEVQSLHLFNPLQRQNWCLEYNICARGCINLELHVCMCDFDTCVIPTPVNGAVTYHQRNDTVETG